MAAARAVACADRDSRLACAVVRLTLACWQTHLVHRGLLRLGVKQFQHGGAHRLTPSRNSRRIMCDIYYGVVSESGTDWTSQSVPTM